MRETSDDTTFEVLHHGQARRLRAATARQAHAWTTEIGRAREACISASMRPGAYDR